MKAIEQYFSCGTVCYAIQAFVILTVECVNDTLVCEHSNESRYAELSSSKVISEVTALISYLQFVVKLKEAVMNQATEGYSCHLSNLWEAKK